MSGGKHLLLLAAFLGLARCQNKLQVSMSPELKTIFSGDLFYLSCNITSGSAVKWYINNTEQQLTDKTLKIAVATPMNSGSYRCESNGQRSEDFNIKVLEYEPSASLIVKTGQPVMRTGGSVVLQLDHETGLEGWSCRVYRGGNVKKIMLRLKGNNASIVFQPKRLNVPETIFWCIHSTQPLRSNQQIIRTTGKDIALEMYPMPAVVGESLTLRCLVWGTDQISHTVFYKENEILPSNDIPTHNIPNVTQSIQGRYKCDATYTHIARTEGPPYHETSDMQDVFVQAAPLIKAVLSTTNGLSCSCPLCQGEMSYRYYKKDGQTWTLVGSSESSIKPHGSGVYACRAVLLDGRSLLSDPHFLSVPDEVNYIPIVVVSLVLVGAMILAVAFFCQRRKSRDITAPVYEDMPMRSQDKGDDKYEQLERARGMGGEYDTLHTETQGRKKNDDEYEALKQEEMKDGLYHTLGVEGGAGGGEYEALKKEGMKGEVYQTLGMGGGAGGGEYEALKKEGMQGDVYQTLGMGGADGGEGGV